MAPPLLLYAVICFIDRVKRTIIMKYYYYFIVACSSGACMHALVRRTYLPVAMKEPRHNRECRMRRFQVSPSALPGAAPQFYFRVANHLGFSLCRRELAQRKFSNNNHPHPPGCWAAANAKLKRISISFFWFRFSRRRPHPSRRPGRAGGSCVEAVRPFCRSQALSFGSAVDRRLLLNNN